MGVQAQFNILPVDSILMYNIKPALVILFTLSMSMCSLPEVPEEITGPADQSYNLLAPTLLSAIPLTDVRIELIWKNNEEYVNEFLILRKMNSSNYETIAIVSKDESTFVDSNCVLNTIYTYSIKTQVESNHSQASNVILAETSFPAPTNLSVSAISEAKILLSWVDNCNFEEGYRIERDSGSGSGYVEIGYVRSSQTSYIDSVNYSADYTYRVAGYTASNVSTWETSTSINTNIHAPSELFATALNDSEIELSWTDNTSYETGFKIERDDGSGYTEIGNVSADVTEYTDTGLTFGQIYNYRIAAYTLVNTSSWTTISASTEFPAPSDLSVSAVSDSELELTWADNCNFEEGFRIERDRGGGFIQIAEVNANTQGYTDTGLTYGQSYNYRVAAYNATNISDYSASAVAIWLLVDYDGNVYQVVQIGDQVWMKENLRVTHYRDGTPISHVTDNATWANLSTEAYCIYNNNASSEVDTYGVLYNWYAAADVHNIAPAGWHVPTDLEWKELEMALGMSQDEADGEYWRGTNEGSKLASNADLWDDGALENDIVFGSSSFNALPGGFRYSDNRGYDMMGNYAYFWSVTEEAIYGAWPRILSNGSSRVSRSGSPKRGGFSIRCLMD